MEQQIRVLPTASPNGVIIRKGITITPQPETKIQIDKRVIDRTVNSDGSVTTREVCDGALEIGPMKTCLNEFGPLQSIGIVAAIAFLIILWRK
jgi:hypothetical protein